MCMVLLYYIIQAIYLLNYLEAAKVFRDLAIDAIPGFIWSLVPE